MFNYLLYCFNGGLGRIDGVENVNVCVCIYACYIVWCCTKGMVIALLLLLLLLLIQAITFDNVLLVRMILAFKDMETS